MIKGLLLDFYGTVVEDDDSTMLAIAGRVAAGSPGRPTGEEVLAGWEREYAAVADGTPFRNLRDCAVHSLATVMAAYGCPGDPAEFGAGQFSGRVLPLRRGTLEFLSRVTVPICVVSDADHAVLSAAIAHHGLRFDAVVCSERVGAYKPHAAMFRHGLAALGLEAGDVMHVGDSLRADVAGANAAGIRSVWVNRRGLPAAEGAAATYVIADLSELSGHL
ncbi:HAD family hydrolase [Actinoplanes sp. CA-142083]|uniref:HAD family hydrolase n=1 Tax=Actinoplanes sp. CA-142083 TaxID=3239903 RepID=UPI003D90F1EE